MIGVKVREPVERKGFFEGIMEFFKKLFGGGEKQTQQATQTPGAENK